MESQVTINVAEDEPPKKPPPPPPPSSKRLSRPKITLTIPEKDAERAFKSPTTAQIPMTARAPQTGQIYWNQMRYHGKAPVTPGSHVSDPQNPYFNPFMQMYHNKASEFMFKQFAGFKDFTMNTAKSGLSAGEKSAFWFYNKLRTLSKKWFTHLFLTLCLVLYSVMGAAIFMALEGTHEEKVHNATTMNVSEIRREAAKQINVVIQADIKSIPLLEQIEEVLRDYESNYATCVEQSCDKPKKKVWGFWNAMFYAGTIYTTIVSIRSENDLLTFFSFFSAGVKVVMSQGNEEKKAYPLTLQIPIIKAESETQTLGILVSKSPPKNPLDMESEKKMSIRKRRNLSKNRGQGARQREKTPEPGALGIHEDTSSDDEEQNQPKRPNSRELEADNTYQEMKRLVQEQATAKDPVYDIDTDEILERRAHAANERRRRSISPFAVPEKDSIEGYTFERRGSFIDPSNKLLSTTYTLSPKDEDKTPRRNSLTIEPSTQSRGSLSPPTSASPKEKSAPEFPTPNTPKKLEEMIYHNEKKEVAKEKPKEDKAKNLRTPVKTNKDSVFTFDEKDVKPADTKVKAAPPKTPETPLPATPAPKPTATKTTETPAHSGEIVTKVIQVERTPSRKLSVDQKPIVDIRERIVRTPSRKLSAQDIKPVLVKQPPKPRDENQPKLPPVKPARSKSATRFGNKTSESEMSEDQNVAAGTRRRILPPRRFVKNRSPRANRSQSVARVEDLKVVDKAGTELTKTGKEIIELMQHRARSLSIPKDDPRLHPAYKHHGKALQTPQNKTPVSRTSRGISCPKTIQIISEKEILLGLSQKTPIKRSEPPQRPKRSKSRCTDASQSEYTSSCYSSSPSENECDFDLSERTAELTRKLNILSQVADQRDTKHLNTIELKTEIKLNTEGEPVLRRRIVEKNGVKKERKQSLEKTETKVKPDEKKKPVKSRLKLLANWQQFIEEQKNDYQKLISLRNRCMCDLLLLIIMFGLGGFIFKSLEGSFENAYKCGTRGVKRDFIESLWRGSHYLREEDWKSLARKKLHEFEDQLHSAHEAGVTSYSGQRSWTFMNSFVYCMTLVTTIGYGHIAPKTTYGRVATIAYAIVGIPLFLIVLADFGKLFTRIIKFFWAFIRRFYYTRSCRKVRRTAPMQEMMKGLNIVYDVVRRPSQIFNEEDLQREGPGGERPPPTLERKPSDVPPPLPPKPGQVIVHDNETEPDTPAPSLFEIDDEFNLPISVAIFILIVYIIIGATVYNIWEDWNFFESFYFVFISMSTIGLGDLVPDHPIFMMASILYLVFGLALTSMCINVVQVKLSDTFKKASAKLGATIGLKVADEDGSLVPITPPPTEDVPVHKPRIEKEVGEEDRKKS